MNDMRSVYDKRENRIFKTGGIVFTLVFVIAFLVVLSSDKAGDVGTLGIICSLLTIFCPIPALACWYGYWDSSRFIKKMEEHGVEVPENKKLQPFTGVISDSTEEDSRESVILAACAGAVTILLFILSVIYVFKWYPLIGSECVFMLFFRAVLIILWCVGAGVYLKQSSKEKYRDAGVVDPARKERTGLPKGILTIIVCLVISLALMRMSESMTDYVYRSRLKARYGESYREHIGEPALYNSLPEE
ncbi:MAG: hypothetical protein K6B44_03625 [Lachnospiraceae bacterium]|nr:hypothetical protein [Lachnospiraceae bacterium]